MNDSNGVSGAAGARGQRSIVLRVVLGFLATLVVAVIALYVLNPSGTASSDPRMRIVGAAPYRVPSASMLPTLQPGAILIVSTIDSDDPLRVGDLIVFRPPVTPGSAFIARVAGLSGDRVRIEAGRTWVNDTLLDEPFLVDQALEKDESRSMAELTIPTSGVFVLGDNRDNAYDSRYFGPAQLDRIEGRVRLQVQ